MGGQQKSVVGFGSSGGNLGDGVVAFDVVAMAGSTVAVCGIMLCRARFNHDCARAQLQFFYVLLHAGDYAHDVFIRRIFPGYATAAFAASRVNGVAAVTRRGHRQTVDEWVIAIRSVTACCIVARLYCMRILSVVGVVPATAVTMRG